LHDLGTGDTFSGANYVIDKHLSSLDIRREGVLKIVAAMRVFLEFTSKSYYQISEIF